MGRSMSRTLRKAALCSRSSFPSKKQAGHKRLPSRARIGRARVPVPTRANRMPTILIIEDEAKMRRLLELNLGDDGFKTLSAGDAETGLKLLASEPVHLVLTDLKLPGISGLEFLQSAKQGNPALPIVVMTAFGSVETAVEAMKAGASDYVLKPFSLAA